MPNVSLMGASSGAGSHRGCGAQGQTAVVFHERVVSGAAGLRALGRFCLSARGWDDGMKMNKAVRVGVVALVLVCLYNVFQVTTWLGAWAEASPRLGQLERYAGSFNELACLALSITEPAAREEIGIVKTSPRTSRPVVSQDIWLWFDKRIVVPMCVPSHVQEKFKASHPGVAGKSTAQRLPNAIPVNEGPDKRGPFMRVPPIAGGLQAGAQLYLKPSVSPTALPRVSQRGRQTTSFLNPYRLRAAD
ncbi:unnamed protein product [Lampetra planeri]